MPAERQRKISVAPPKMAWTSIAAAAAFHAVGFAALVTWSSSSTNSHVRFAGREQAFQLTLSFAEPQWNVDPVTLDDFEIDPPVVIEPIAARIGKHTYVHAPTVELSPTIELATESLFLDSAIAPAQSPPELTMLDDLQEVLERPAKKTPAKQPSRTNPTKPDSALVQTPSRLGNTEEIPPDLSQNIPPTFPSPAIQSGWEGTVLLRVWINEAGQVTKVEVARTSGYRILDGAAATAVRRWNAIPAEHQGKPVASIELLPVHFKL